MIFPNKNTDENEKSCPSYETASFFYPKFRIMEKIKTASFSIEQYYFDQVHINMEDYKGDNIDVDFQPSGVFYEKEKKYKLSFVFLAYSTGSKEEEKPFVRIKCTGIFQLMEVEKLKDIPEFFYRNSIAILFPYLRAYVSIVTVQANIRPIILPTLNLSSLEKPLKENTSTE